MGSQIGGERHVSNVDLLESRRSRLPAHVLVTLAVRNVGAGGDIGFSQVSTNLDIDNIYLVANSRSAVPKPATAGATVGFLALLGCVRYRR